MIKQYPTHVITHVATLPLTSAADHPASRHRPAPTDPDHTMRHTRPVDRHKRSFHRYVLGLALSTLVATLGYAPGALAAWAWVSFKADRTSISSGETVLLSWASAKVWNCSASGAWWGSRATSGYYRTRALTSDATYRLTCQSAQGSITRSVFVDVVTSGTTVTPSLTLQSSSSVQPGGNVTLSWTGQAVTNCQASGAWSGTRPTSGTETRTLNADSTFGLTCQTAQGSISRSVFVDVVSTTPTVTPTLTLQSSSSAVRSGESVTLTWAGQAVTNCQASGSWTGARPASGTEVRSQLTTNQSYTLSCDSASGRIVAMTSVQITSGGTEITWSPPTRNDDGTPLTDLAGYRIHVGTTSRNYYQQVNVTDPAATRYFLELLPGEYFIAMTALDAQGNESALSNEVRKLVQ